MEDSNEEGARISAARDLTRMIDSAITEGANLRLPMFVWLLRLARLELANNIETWQWNAVNPPTSNSRGSSTTHGGHK